MPKRRLEDELEMLGALRADPSSAEAKKLIRRALASRISILAAKAAGEVAQAQLDELVPELVAAFDRFLENPQKEDKGCAAKIEIVKALRALSCYEPDVFLRGIRHVQKEGSFGPPVDTAAELRGHCALALVDINYPDVMLELAALLVDQEPYSRIGAIRALAASSGPEAAPMLRLKVLCGDNEPEVLGECFTALLIVDAPKSVPFVAERLDAPEADIAAAAAMALGETRREDAFAALHEGWKRCHDAGLRRTLLLAVATMRIEPGFDFLFELIAKGGQRDSDDAVAALAIYSDEPQILQKVERLREARTGTSGTGPA